MKVTQNRLRLIRADALKVIEDMTKLADHLDQASKDQISPGDVDILGLWTAEAFIRDNKHFLETMG